jgi:hypothetical protein
VWTVEWNAVQARAASTLEEALAFSAHLTIRGHEVTCIKRNGRTVMDAPQIRYALDNLDNGLPPPVVKP